MDNADGSEMPKYRSHKTVWALKIRSVSLAFDGGAIITPADAGYAPFKVPADYVSKHKPMAVGYYVVYADGYKSWSPAGAFEEGYTRV